MPKSLNNALSAAVLRILRPLVAVLLRHGMAYGTFAELARKAYVEEGFAQVPSPGKRVTVSSVSALTGLTRKETKRLRELERENAERKKMVAEQALDIRMLKDVNSRKW